MLGLIDPDKYLGGRMKLDADLAREAVGRLAERLGLSLMETAAGISTVVDAKMADLVRRMSLLRGLDPRRFACAAFGGGGPLHSPAVAAQAGIRTLIVPLPRAASVWSAFGAATSDVAHVFQRWTVVNLPARGADVEAIFGELEKLARTTLDSQGVSLDNVSLVRSVRMRYSMQIHDVEVPVSAGTIDDAAVAALDSDVRAHPRRALRQGLRLPCRRRGLHGVPGAGHGPHHEAVARRRHARPALGVLALDLLARAPRGGGDARRSTPFPPTPCAGPR